MGAFPKPSALQAAFSARGTGGSVASLVGMLLTVAAVLALAYWVTKLIARKGLPGWASGMAGGDRLQVLWQVSLGKSERLVLVRLDKRCLLLGVTSGGISVLTELTEEEAAQWPREREEIARQPNFLDILRENLPKKK